MEVGIEGERKNLTMADPRSSFGVLVNVLMCEDKHARWSNGWKDYYNNLVYKTSTSSTFYLCGTRGETWAS